MELNNIIFFLFLILFGYFITKYLIAISEKYNFKFIIDDQFKKPQAFHEKPTFRIGGIIIYILLNLIFLYSFYFKKMFYPEYISFCSLFFFLGLTDDIKFQIRPKFRLLIMFTILISLIIYNDLYITKTGLGFLNNLLQIDVFSVFFICLCFLFIINGSNLVDGFNGLLGLHSLIILLILFGINYYNSNHELVYFLSYFIIIIIIFLAFNFPIAKVFLGDSGAYLIGTLLSILTIQTSILNPEVSPIFFTILLSYLFFEVFFSFFRKLFFAKQSPLLPDNKHIHMYLFKFLKKKKSKMKSNYLVSIYINLVYLFLIIPSIIFMKNGIFCRYYFFFLIIMYIYFYKKLYVKINNL